MKDNTDMLGVPGPILVPVLVVIVWMLALEVSGSRGLLALLGQWIREYCSGSYTPR